MKGEQLRRLTCWPFFVHWVRALDLVDVSDRSLAWVGLAGKNTPLT